MVHDPERKYLCPSQHDLSEHGPFPTSRYLRSLSKHVLVCCSGFELRVESKRL